MKYRRRRSAWWEHRRSDPGRVSGAPPDRDRGAASDRRLRAGAAALAVLELGLLSWIALAPAFPVRHVSVSGLHRLRDGQVVAAVGLDRPVSVFVVDAATIHRKLTEMPWVRDASVSAVLPDRVQVRVSEWQPVAIYRSGASGQPYFVSNQAIALGPAAPSDAGGLLAVEGPPGPDPRPGRVALDVRLLTAMVNLRNGLPALVGVSVASMSVDCSGNLTLTTSRGWRVIFGRVLTPEEFATLKDKLSALKAVSAEANFQAPDFEYINLENPSAPAVGPKPGAPRPTPSPSSAPGGIKPILTPPPAAAGIQVIGCR